MLYDQILNHVDKIFVMCMHACISGITVVVIAEKLSKGATKAVHDKEVAVQDHHGTDNAG